MAGDAKYWPSTIRKLFWGEKLHYYERFLICCFSFVNGINPEFLIDWCEVKGLCADRHAMDPVKNLMRTFEEGTLLYRYYAYNVDNRRQEYLNGKPRRTG